MTKFNIFSRSILSRMPLEYGVTSLNDIWTVFADRMRKGPQFYVQNLMRIFYGYHKECNVRNYLLSTFLSLFLNFLVSFLWYGCLRIAFMEENAI